MRKEFEITQPQLDKLLAAMRPVPYMIFGGMAPKSPQENANAAWAALGNEMGFDGMTVLPVQGKSSLFFTAEAIEAPADTAKSAAEGDFYQPGIPQTEPGAERACLQEPEPVSGGGGDFAGAVRLPQLGRLTVASINNMVKKTAGLIDTKDVSDWENRFLKNIVAQTHDGDNTSSLSENQVGRLEEIYEKHFAD